MINFRNQRVTKIKVKSVKIIIGSLLMASILFMNFNSINGNAIFAISVKNLMQDEYIKTEDSNEVTIIADDIVNKNGIYDDINNTDSSDDQNKSDKPIEPDKPDETDETDEPDEPDKPAIPVEPVKASNPANALQVGPFIVSNPSDLLVLVNKKNRLPTDYIPENLVVPNVSFTFNEYSERRMMRQDAASALEKMFVKAREYNIFLYGLSGYRSYNLQQSIFASNVSKYGFERANQFSAKPGESEHQTGLAMDITSASVGYGLTQSFGDTQEGRWVKDNAHKYGFIIRYQRGREYITGYQYEPWHLRYVGMEAAAVIVNRNITLEEYLAGK